MATTRRVNTNAKVPNLIADLFDGVDSASFLGTTGKAADATGAHSRWEKIGSRRITRFHARSRGEAAWPAIVT